MTKLLDQACEAALRLTPAVQDEIAELVLRRVAGQGEPEPINPADLPAVLKGLSQARRREFASDAEIESLFRRFERSSCGSRRAGRPSELHADAGAD